jgi:single-stranded-DNA-specific exonuclease
MMDTPQPQWQLVSSLEIPQWFVEAVKRYTPNSDGRYAAQLLWHRGIRDAIALPQYLDPDYYQPTSPFDFGQEMKWAVKRLQQARQRGEKVTIWGDFDADGITSTSVLWEGLGQFFPQSSAGRGSGGCFELAQYLQLDYYIPNRLRESHGLNQSGIDKLAQQGTRLIVTCDTGSTNLEEITHARELGIDIIVTDHHTLPEERPPVVAIINPRYFAETHPLYHLSGVAVAYKLVEALYQTLPDVPQQPLATLLDLVAIGLIADLVELKGDCRYLAQKGIQQLQKQVNPTTATRPGVAQLLELCRRNGDRPTDISYGLGPRINAVSRIHGDASFCVELLTSRDRSRCKQLAEETELANTRRKSLQKDITQQVKKKLERIDLSTTSVIVLEDSQWQGGVLGLVAGQIAQEFGRPTILLSSTEEENVRGDNNSQSPLARGSARSLNKIDLYQLVKSQEHLLHRFGGHPFAAGLSLPTENLPLFREGINQQLRQQADSAVMMLTIEADLVVTVADLGKNLFDELKLLEPCGMGNPIPKLLIQNCRFTNVWHDTKDRQGRKVQYIKTTFNLWDDSVEQGFPGVWWGHYKDEIPQADSCDVMVELDFNTYKKRYEVRLIAVKTTTDNFAFSNSYLSQELIIDRRNNSNQLKEVNFLKIQPSHFRILKKCPQNWDEMQKKYRQAIADRQKLVLAYPPPPEISSQETWRQLVGIAKYLSRTLKKVTKLQLQEKLSLSDRTLNLGLTALVELGFTCHSTDEYLYFEFSSHISDRAAEYISSFLAAVEEEQFQRQYFYQVPLATLQTILSHQG